MMSNPLRLGNNRVPLSCLALATLLCGGSTAMSENARPPIPKAAALAKLPPDGGPNWNRLVFEKSPYLLQHAANPVDWFPWGDEAFALAAAQDKPVLLSIGYSTCHWCHVMEHESFEDEEVAALMNEQFVCIKVDREERPDIDQIYMTVTQAMTGSGGWPMTVMMRPDRKPFFAGTYFPKNGRGGRPGMVQLIPAIARAWKEDREQIDATAEGLTSELARYVSAAPGDALGKDELNKAFEQLSARHDDARGGFGKAPKFPTPHVLSSLLRHWKRTKSERALEMVNRTLIEMRRGGIYDQVGHGFARYSTDAEWLLPHFEKMLYDQALHVIAYTEAYEATGREEHAAVAKEIIGYVLRDMTSPEGAFYSAEDADSEGEEGKFYVWTPEQIQEVLGEKDGELYARIFGVVAGGNFQDQATGQATGESILHLKTSLAEVAKAEKLDEGALSSRLESMRKKLFKVREGRIHPYKDDKVLTDWNGLMIVALAKASRALDDEEYAHAAGRAADFILTNLRTKEGRLLKRYRDGEAAHPAVLDDYAFLIWGLSELYETSFDPRWLSEAVALSELMVKHFGEKDQGGFFLSADDGEQLLARAKEIQDGAIPSGNSVAALALQRLARQTGRTDFDEQADGILKAFSGLVTQGPSSFCQLMLAVDFSVGPTREVVISGDPKSSDTQAMVDALRDSFEPTTVVLLRPSRKRDAAKLAKVAPFTAFQPPIDGKATAYVCENHACSAPTTDIKTMLALLTATAEGDG